MSETDSTKTGNTNTQSVSGQRVASEIHVPEGWHVRALGVIGSLLGIAPAAMLLPRAPELPYPWTVLGPVCWACFVGGLVTRFWSKALHDRMEELGLQLNAVDALEPEEKKHYPLRLPWMPAWLGLFERAFYCLLIGLRVPGGATFIGAWIVLKLAGGWQTVSKGTMYGRAIYAAGLLGNAMSILFGVVAGLVIDVLLDP